MITVCTKRKYCETCPNFSPTTIIDPIYKDGIAVGCNTLINCANYELCKRIETYLKEKIINSV